MRQDILILMDSVYVIHVHAELLQIVLYQLMVLPRFVKMEIVHLLVNQVTVLVEVDVHVHLVHVVQLAVVTLHQIVPVFIAKADSVNLLVNRVTL